MDERIVQVLPTYIHQTDIRRKQIKYKKKGKYCTRKEWNKPEDILRISYDSQHTPFETHCRLGNLSLPLLKMLCPQFLSLLSLDCESCQFEKHHHLHSSPRVNKPDSAPFELVHSDVWGVHVQLCPQFGFDIITFVNDYSRTTWLYLIKNRNELFSHFHAFCAKIHSISCFCSKSEE